MSTANSSSEVTTMTTLGEIICLVIDHKINTVEEARAFVEEEALYRAGKYSVSTEEAKTLLKTDLTRNIANTCYPTLRKKLCELFELADKEN